MVVNTGSVRKGGGVPQQSRKWKPLRKKQRALVEKDIRNKGEAVGRSKPVLPGSQTLSVLLYRYTFWSRHGVLQHNFWRIWLQNVVDFVKQPPLTDAMVQMYNEFYDERYVGIYELFKPRLYVKDPELIKNILVKDFDHFVDHNRFLPTDGDPIWEKSLFTLQGNEWKRLRGIASPSFTSSKMKIMFDAMVKCSQKFLHYLDNHPGEEVITLEMKDVFGRLTSDIYFATHFGISCDSLREPKNECYLMGKLGADFGGFQIKFRIVFLQMFPKIAKLLGVKALDQRVNAFFRKLVRNNIDARTQNKIVRPDLINLLMENQNGDCGLIDEEIVALAISFFGGGFESVSSLLSFILYELAFNVKAQRRLQEEIDTYVDKALTYGTLQQMKYLNMVVSETLRKWPIGFFLERRCVKPYTISPVKKGEVAIHLKEDDQIWIPLYALQRDAQIYKNPDVFNPERFNKDDEIDSYMYMPFGIGPRHCIGNRYALLVTKVVIFHFFSKYNVKAVDKTDSPIRLARSYFQLVSKGKFWLGCQQRTL
ncbi:hypothetical protein FQR65_LT01426 [Abscondita terminalis]|nr:hypothetical protein FQR65_LT01426 [Abscondita terminalis]